MAVIGTDVVLPDDLLECPLKEELRRVIGKERILGVEVDRKITGFVVDISKLRVLHIALKTPIPGHSQPNQCGVEIFSISEFSTELF